MKKNIVASSFFLMIVIGLFLTLLMSCTDEIPLYMVRFDSQGGSNIAPLEGIRQGSKITEPTAPTRNGYDFNGWYKDSECTIEWKFGSDTVETSWTLYAKWVVALYSVNFDSLGGTVVPTNEDIEYGAKIREPVSPTRDECLFDGWYLDSSCTNRWYFTTDTVTSNLTLYAKWLSPHTVAFNSQGGTSVPSINDVGHGNKINEPISPTRSGSVFDGWYLESTCINQWDFTTDIVTSNLTLYAKWLGPYTVVFNSQEGTIVPTFDDVGHGTKVNEPVPPTRRGYLFDGWYLDDSCTNRWYFNTDTVTSNLTLYAKWLPLHFVSFNSQGGSGVHAIEVLYGKRLNVPESPTKSGYIFDGWYLESTCRNRWDFLKNVTSNMILYAKWIPQYTVFFDSQGGTPPDPNSVTVIYKQAYGELPTVTKEGYAFGGWWTEEGGTGERVQRYTTVSITNDQILYAKWNIISYGPAGGYIFYDKGSYSDGWRYLEAAPAGNEWRAKVWGGFGTEVGGTGTAVGTGASNTEKIVAKFGNAEPYGKKADYAAKLCADLVVTKDGVEYDDWFLPSKDELNLMYQTLKRNDIGNFSEDLYWSSSEANTGNAWKENFYYGSQDLYGRYGNGRVRPVRAF